VNAAGLGAPVQIAYAVPDARAAAAQWVDQFGAGPFFVRPHIRVGEVVYRGQPSIFDHTSAYGQWGSLMVELVQDHGTAPSVVRERYAPDESGLHHLAFIVADLDDVTDRLVAGGHPLVMTARTSNTRFHFIDAVATVGHMIELYEDSDRVRAFYEMVRAAAEVWDGSDPIRELAS
jgi:catechol 2,3-dioxygenase-like lactoylglutathione lyase family enzyme